MFVQETEGSERKPKLLKEVSVRVHFRFRVVYFFINFFKVREQQNRVRLDLTKASVQTLPLPALTVPRCLRASGGGACDSVGVLLQCHPSLRGDSFPRFLILPCVHTGVVELGG